MLRRYDPLKILLAQVLCIISGTPSTKYNGVAYRERVIIQGKHQFLRPQYGTPVAENQKKKK